MDDTNAKTTETSGQTELAAPQPEAAEVELWIENLESIWAEPKPMKWLVEGLIPEQSVVMVAGESGCGKSTLLLALADAVSRGTKFLGRTTEQCHALIVDRENPRHVYYERTKRMHLEPSNYLHVWGLWADPQPEGPDSDRIVKFVKKRQPLLIFDSLVAFHGGSEQDSTETRKYMQQFRNLAAHGATVLLIHHTGKGENTKEYRGSSDIKASVDLNFVLTSKDSRLRHLVLKPGKCREGVVSEVQITYREGTGRFEETANSQWSLIKAVVQGNPGINQKGIQQKLKDAIPNHTVIEILERSVAENRLRSKRGQYNAQCYYLAA